MLQRELFNALDSVSASSVTDYDSLERDIYKNSSLETSKSNRRGGQNKIVRGKGDNEASIGKVCFLLIGMKTKMQ